MTDHYNFDLGPDGPLQQPLQKAPVMTSANKTFVFNLMRITFPNLTRVSVILAATREEAERNIPAGWKIVTAKEMK